MDDNSEPARDTALQASERTRIREAHQQASNARKAAAEDLESLADKWSNKLRDVAGGAEDAPPV